MKANPEPTANDILKALELEAKQGSEQMSLMVGKNNLHIFLLLAIHCR